MDLILPIVHRNGTSRESLITQRCEAGAALRDALSRLSDMAPNARDYYLKDGLLGQAQAQHDRRVAAIRAVLDELVAETDTLAEAE